MVRSSALTLASQRSKKLVMLKSSCFQKQTCSKLAIEALEAIGRRSGVFIVNFEHVSHLYSSVSIVNFEHVNAD